MPLNMLSDATLTDAADALDVLAMALTGGARYRPSVMQKYIRAGLGPRMFPVGYRFAVNHRDYGTYIRRVKGHNINPDPTGRLQHTMTTEMVTCIYGRQISATQALYYVDASRWPSGLPAGTYHFTLLAGYDTACGGGKTLQFTTTQPVPVGGVIMFPWAYNTQSTAIKISTYAAQLDTTLLEGNISVVEGSGGTSLGTADGQTPFVNHAHRIRYGSNHYGESAARQWLNSGAAAGAWFEAQTVFDRPPNYANVAGFLNGHDDEFLSVLVPVDIVCARNTVYEYGGVTGGSYTLRDVMFLPSMNELGLGNNNGIAEGVVSPYYVGATNTDRIRYTQAAQTTACYYWLRSCYHSSTGLVRVVYPSGEMYSNYVALDGYGLSPDCVIG